MAAQADVPREVDILAARRGGVAVRPALLEIDKAVDSQIELEVLVHAFSLEDGSEFMEKHAQGLEHARSALTAGQSALAELELRRRGLAISLVVILVLLVALAMKIRQLSSSSAAAR